MTSYLSNIGKSFEALKTVWTSSQAIQNPVPGDIDEGKEQSVEAAQLAALVGEENAREIQGHILKLNGWIKNKILPSPVRMVNFISLGKLDSWTDRTLDAFFNKIMTNFALAVIQNKNNKLLEGTEPFTQTSLEEIREFLVKLSEDYLQEINESESNENEPEEKMREVVERILSIAMPNKKDDIPLLRLYGSDTIGDYRNVIWNLLIGYGAPRLLKLRTKYKESEAKLADAYATITAAKGGSALLALIEAITTDPSKFIDKSIQQETISSKILRKLLTKFGADGHVPNNMLTTLAAFVKPFLIPFAADLVKLVPPGEHLLAYLLKNTVDWVEEEVKMVQRLENSPNKIHIQTAIKQSVQLKLSELGLDDESLNKRISVGGDLISGALESFFIALINEFYNHVVTPIDRGIKFNDKDSEAIIRAMARGILPLVREALGAKEDDEADFQDAVQDEEQLAIAALAPPPAEIVHERLLKFNLKVVLNQYIDTDVAEAIAKFADDGALEFAEGEGWDHFEKYASIYIEHTLLRIFSHLAGGVRQDNVFQKALEKTVGIVLSKIDVEPLRNAYILWNNEGDPTLKAQQESQILTLLNPCFSAIIEATGLEKPGTLNLPDMFRNKVDKIIKEKVIKKLLFETCFDLLAANHPGPAVNENLRDFVGTLVPQLKDVIFKTLAEHTSTIAHAINMNAARGKIELEGEVNLAEQLRAFLGNPRNQLDAPVNGVLHSVLYKALNNMANAYGAEPAEPLMRVIFQLRKRIAEQNAIAPDFNEQVLAYLKASASLKEIESALSTARREGNAEEVERLAAVKEKIWIAQGEDLKAQLAEIKDQVRPFLIQILGDMGFNRAEDLPLPRQVQDAVWKMLIQDLLPEQLLELYSNFIDNDEVFQLATATIGELPKGADVVDSVKTLGRYAMQMIDNYVVANGAKIADMIQGKKGEGVVYPVGATIRLGERILGAFPPEKKEFFMPALEQNINSVILIALDALVMQINRVKEGNPDLIFRISLEGMKLMTNYLNGRGEASNEINEAEYHALLQNILKLLGITSAAELTFVPLLAREAVWNKINEPATSKLIFEAIFENLLSPKMMTGLLTTTVNSVNGFLEKSLKEKKVKNPDGPAVADLPAEQQEVILEFIKAMSKQFPGSGMNPLVGFLTARNMLNANAIGISLRSVVNGMDFVSLMTNGIVDLAKGFETTALKDGVPVTEEQIHATKEASDRKYEAEKEAFVTGFKKLWMNIKAVVVESVSSSWFGWIMHIVLYPIEWLVFKWIEFRVFRKNAAKIRDAIVDNTDNHKKRFLVDLMNMVQAGA